MRPTGRLTRLDSDRVAGLATYYADAYGDGRFWVKRLLAGGGQSYVLLVEDTWSHGTAVLKGRWWKNAELDNPYTGNELAFRNAELLQGLRATRQATQLTQQAPIVVEELREPAPALRAVGHPKPPTELFVVQQFVGHGWTSARTLKDELATRAEEGRQFAEAELLDLADQLCNTLAALHVPRRRDGGNRTTYWIHADIKPENILVLGSPWRYVLIDYEGAVEKGEEIRFTTELYGPPTTSGSLERQAADQRYDLYMLGTTLAEAAGLRRLDEELQNAFYSGDRAAHTAAKRRLADLGYGPILTSIVVSCLSGPDFRLADVRIIQDELARARLNSTLHRALLND
jgi:serine/threonine protein kinase